MEQKKSIRAIECRPGCPRCELGCARNCHETYPKKHRVSKIIDIKVK